MTSPTVTSPTVTSPSHNPGQSIPKITRRDALRFGSVLTASLTTGLTAEVITRLQGAPSAHAQESPPLGRLLVFYFPDGIPGRSDQGDPNLWDCEGSGRNFNLSECLAPLARHRDRCAFINGLSMGPTDSGSHPGGAKKLLTGVDGGYGRSLDQHLATQLGAQTPFRHLYLGVQSGVGNPSSDHFISYQDAGQVATPEDDPRRVLERLFGQSALMGVPDQPTGEPDEMGRVTEPQQSSTHADLSALRGALAEVEALRAQSPRAAHTRLDRQASALREVSRQLDALGMIEERGENGERGDMGGSDINGSNEDASSPTSCAQPALSGAWSSWPERLDQPELFPTLLRAQSELMALALSCQLTRVGVIQCSHHTSELIMSRFPDAPFSDPNYDMRSHQASHYGATHDRNKREFTDYVAQRTWFVEQYARLLDMLASYPEGDGTLLDSTLVLLCTEVSDGNSHDHNDMPFVLAGGSRLGMSGGQVIQAQGRRHSDLLASICHLLGEPVDGYGQGGRGTLGALWG